MLKRVDARARIDFYVREGLVSRAPTDEELARTEALNTGEGAGVVQRMRYYTRHPLELFPTERKKRRLRQPSSEVQTRGLAKQPVTDAEHRQVTEREPGTRLDEWLRALFLWSPARFVVQLFFNPYYALPGSGLDIPAHWLIEHLLHSPHPSALWDVQILHPDPGALDELVRRIDHYEKSTSLKARAYRALAQREGYYDYLRELVDQVRRFDYPPTRPNCRPEYENLVLWLRLAIGEAPSETAD
jgi:hypothetical protein